MLRVRLVEETIATRYAEQEMRCPTHLTIGEEAIATGVSAHLKKNDVVFSAHRSHGHYLAKGGNLKKMIAEIYGKETGCCLGRGGSQHLIDTDAGFLGAVPIVSETIPLAVGSALSSQMRKRKNISVVFFGDAATEEGVFHESLNYASLYKLPVLFVCENNLYSICTPLSDRQPKRSIAEMGKSYHMMSFTADGNDLLTVYKVAQKAISSIRKGRGPVLLEFLTYRHREHCGPNFEPVGFRPKKEFDHWMKRDPVKKMKRYLVSNRVLKQEELVKIEHKIRQEIDAAFEFAKRSPFPEKINEGQAYAI